MLSWDLKFLYLHIMFLLSQIRMEMYDEVKHWFANFPDELGKVRSNLANMMKRKRADLRTGSLSVRVLEFFVTYLACDDPGQQLAQPVLQLMRQQLVAAATQHAAEQAEKAWQEILALEEVGASSLRLIACKDVHLAYLNECCICFGVMQLVRKQLCTVL